VGPLSGPARAATTVGGSISVGFHLRLLTVSPFAGRGINHPTLHRFLRRVRSPDIKLVCLGFQFLLDRQKRSLQGGTGLVHGDLSHNSSLQPSEARLF
jgi:hypothetical protein